MKLIGSKEKGYKLVSSFDKPVKLKSKKTNEGEKPNDKGKDE